MIFSFFKISIISHIKELCEKICSSQIQKLKFSLNWKLFLAKSTTAIPKQNFITSSNMKKIVENQPKYSFIEYMSYKLKKYGKKTTVYQEILEKEVQKILDKNNLGLAEFFPEFDIAKENSFSGISLAISTSRKISFKSNFAISFPPVPVKTYYSNACSERITPCLLLPSPLRSPRLRQQYPQRERSCTRRC